MYSFATSFVLLVLFMRFILPCGFVLLALIFSFQTEASRRWCYVWLVHNLFICPPANGHFGCFPVFAITNNITLNTFYLSPCEYYQEFLQGVCREWHCWVTDLCIWAPSALQDVAITTLFFGTIVPVRSPWTVSDSPPCSMFLLHVTLPDFLIFKLMGLKQKFFLQFSFTSPQLLVGFNIFSCY